MAENSRWEQRKIWCVTLFVMDGSQSPKGGTATAALASTTGWVKWKCWDRRPCGDDRDHKYLAAKDCQGLGHETRNVLMRACLAPWCREYLNTGNRGNQTVGK